MSTRYKIRDQEKSYFVTFTVVQWVDVFTPPLYRDILLESIRYCQIHKELLVHAWCIMTNPIHLIVSSKGSQPLEATIRDLKKFSSRQIIQAIEQNSQESRQKWMLWIFRSAAENNPNNTHYPFWVQNSHPIELSYAQIAQQKLNYIHANPVEAGIVSKPEDYLYSSTGDYAGLKGMLEIDFLF